MFNFLKIQNKKYIIFPIIVSSICLPSMLNAQSKGKKNSARLASKNMNSARKINTKSKVATTSGEQQNTSVKQEIDVSTITKYNCEEFYNKCMNKTCYNTSNGRCSCNQQAKFDEANKLCEYITKACPSQANDIVKTFARNAATDCRNINLASNEGNFKNINNYFADTITCLKPKCNSRKDGNFVGCFDDDNLENRLETCKNSYNGVSDIDELKKMIKESFISYKTKYCNEMFGTMKDDGNCYLTIGIGVAAGDIKRTKEFKIGDTIVCSSKAFNTSMGKDEAARLTHIKNITMAGINMVSQGLSAASSIVGGSSAGGAVEIISAAATGLGATEDIMALAQNDYSYTGKCFVISNGKAHELLPEDNSVGYKLRWSENWRDIQYGN
ncbi:hypothetical protein HDR59_03840 [bacterium]|nr:hypothetical protein [bacterium]